VIAQASVGETSPLIDQQIARATQATMKYYGEMSFPNANLSFDVVVVDNGAVNIVFPENLADAERCSP
jgi:hypothetical protein